MGIEGKYVRNTTTKTVKQLIGVRKWHASSMETLSNTDIEHHCGNCSTNGRANDNRM
jgi:hypothetical protein